MSLFIFFKSEHQNTQGFYSAQLATLQNAGSSKAFLVNLVDWGNCNRIYNSRKHLSAGLILFPTGMFIHVLWYDTDSRLRFVCKITSEMKEMEFSYCREKKDPPNGNNELTFMGIFLSG